MNWKNNYSRSEPVEVLLNQPGGSIWTRATVAGTAIDGSPIVTIPVGRSMQRVNVTQAAGIRKL